MMIRLSRLFILMLLCMMFLSVGMLSYVHYQGMKRYATQTLITELGSEAYVIKENLHNELGALTGGLRLLTGHETIIKGVSSLFYWKQKKESFRNSIRSPFGRSFVQTDSWRMFTGRSFAAGWRCGCPSRRKIRS